MDINQFAPNLSFSFRKELTPKYAVQGESQEEFGLKHEVENMVQMTVLKMLSINIQTQEDRARAEIDIQRISDDTPRRYAIYAIIAISLHYAMPNDEPLPLN